MLYILYMKSIALLQRVRDRGSPVNGGRDSADEERVAPAYTVGSRMQQANAVEVDLPSASRRNLRLTTWHSLV